MKKLIIVLMAAALSAAFTGCQTAVHIECDATTPLPIQQLVNDNGTNRVITTGYFEGRPHYLVTARSPLWARESVAKFGAEVGAGGTWNINADGYSRDLSTNAVAITKEMFAGGANLAIAIGDAYTKIAGGGAQAATVLSVAQRVCSYFASKGGDASKATVTTDSASNTLKVSDGTTCVECDANGNCTDCELK